MQYSYIHAGLLLLLALLLAGCGLGTRGEGRVLVPGDEVQLRGTVVDTIYECVVDGICALVVESDGGRYTAVWAEGMQRCEGEIEDGLARGDAVEVHGVAQDTDRVSICRSDTHYIRQATHGEATR
jgi:hypothetical protein